MSRGPDQRIVPMFVCLLLPAGCSGYHSFFIGSAVAVADDYPGIEHTRSAWPHPGSHRSSIRQSGYLNRYTAHLRGFEIVQQANNYSCWAACCEMVLNFVGQPTSQTEIIRMAKGDLVVADEGYGTGLEIMDAIGGAGKHVHYDSGNATRLAVDIADGWPVIIGMKRDSDIGHAVVVVGITVSWQGQAALVHSVRVADPSPGAGIRRLSGRDFAERIDGAIHMRSAVPPGMWR